MSTRIYASVLVAVTVSLTSCGDADGPELTPVSGHVTFDGEPLAKAQIYFNATSGGGRTASAVTDEAGYYELAYTRSHKGAQLGPHYVTISKLEFDPNNDEDSGREVLPKEYQDQGTITVDITEGGQPYDFELVSK